MVAVYLGLALANPMDSTVHGDGYYTYLWARTIVFDGDLDFHDDYRTCGDGWNLRSPPIGDDLNYWNMGPALFWIPILAFDRLTHPATHSPDIRVATGCVPPLSERAVLGSMLAGFLTIWLGFLIARRHFGDGVGFAGAAGIALLTGLAYYSTMMLSYGHAASAFGAGLSIWAWDKHRIRPSVRGWAIQGLAFGVAILMRSQNAIVVILPLASWIAEASTHARGRDGRALAKHVGAGFLFAGLGLLLFFPQLWFWKHSTGSWFTVSQGEHYMRWTSPMWHKALFSASGLIPWTPIHVPAILGLVALALRRRTRALGVAMIAVFVLNTWVAGAVYDWWGSVGFPGRRFDMLTVPFMIGLAAFVHEIRLWALRKRQGAVLGVAGAVAVLVMGFWNVSAIVGVALALRTDVPQPSPQYWRATFGRTLDPLWRAVGNPLTWPASIPFAIHYGTHPRRWDMVGGREIFYHDHQDLHRRPHESILDFSREQEALYVDGPAAGDSITTFEGQRGIVLSPGSSRIFLPLHYPHAGRFDLAMRAIAEPARVSLRVNRVSLGTRQIQTGGARTARYPVPFGATEQGINELWVWVEGAPILLTRIDVQDPPEDPERDQTRRNRELLEERRRLVGARPGIAPPATPATPR